MKKAAGHLMTDTDEAERPEMRLENTKAVRVLLERVLAAPKDMGHGDVRLPCLICGLWFDITDRNFENPNAGWDIDVTRGNLIRRDVGVKLWMCQRCTKEQISYIKQVTDWV